jgi:TolB-like protein/Flp pilus assembly protein TadD
MRAGELRKQGLKIKLQDQPFQILVMLLEHPGQVVTREELRSKLWPANTFVDFDHSLNKAINKLREALGDSAESPRFVETLPRRGYRFLEPFEHKQRRAIDSIAVLPLENLSCDPEQDYFADGLTEALITNLAKISALRVVSRTTAMHYKGVHRPLRELARELQVEGIVEGTVQRFGKRVRISVQLIHATADAHLWAESYERDLRDILGLEAELAQAIAREVQVTLTPQEQAQLAQAHVVEPEAYEAYLKGRYHWNRRSGDALAKGTECFQRAIERDPSYAAAYAGLADCASSAGWLGFIHPDEGCGKGKRLAQKALNMDANLAEAHTSLAWATVHYDFDFALSETEYERSIQLNPRYATAYMWFSLLLAATGRLEEAITECKRAVRLDPLALMISAGLGWIYWCAHRYDEMIEQFRKTLELDSNFAPPHWGLGLAYSGKSMHEPAIAEMRKAVELSHGSTLVVGLLGEAYAIAGYRDDAQEVLAQLEGISKQQYVTPYIIARIYAALDKSDEVFLWLETAFRERAAWMVYLSVDSRLDSLRSDPRFQDLLRRMNFPQKTKTSTDN